jgi:hypothetical protein
MSSSTTEEQELSSPKVNETVQSSNLSSDVDVEKETPVSQPVPSGPPAPPPPPNGGLKAWLQVLGGFLFVLNTW